jgi:hypothetical protein
MVFLKWAFLIFLTVIAGILLSQREAVHEFFVDAAETTLEEQLVAVYTKVLQRQPTSKELVADTRDLRAGTLTLKGLRQRLIDTEEYARNMKLQSNGLAPELEKVLSDAELFKVLQEIYKIARPGKTMPANLLLPYRDIYVYLDYNEYTFRAFLAHKSYEEFEKEVLRVTDMDRESLIALFNMTFDKKELITEGIKLGEADVARAAARAAALGTSASAAVAVPAAAGPTDALARPADSKDPSIAATITRILEGTREGTLDKDAKARILDEIQKIQDNPNLSAEEKRQAIAAIVAIANQDAIVNATTDSILGQYGDSDYIDVPTHEGNMVLRPEFAWSVPQRRPPVCNMLGQKPNIRPVFVNSELLLGTPLHEAADTEVGTMMPKFKYQTYQSVPIRKQQPLGCPAPPPATPATPAPTVPTVSDASKK